MKILYIDCFCGASGDMFLAASLSLFEEKHRIIEALRKIPSFKKAKILLQNVKKKDICALSVKVEGERVDSCRILNELEESDLDDWVKKKSKEIIHLIAEAEKKVHGVSHAHILEQIDTFFEVIGTVLCIKECDVKEIFCSPIPLGSGFIEGHGGKLPIPCFATLHILEGTPVHSGNIEGELTTPTGAAIIKALTHSFSSMPGMIIKSIGYGAGEREYKIPNILRLIIGEREEEAKDIVYLLQTNIDDTTPQVFGYLMEILMKEGALDVYYTPCFGKKNRPLYQLTVLCDEKDREKMLSLIFSNTPTLGVRIQKVERRLLQREEIYINTPFGSIKAKRAGGRIFPEYEDCKEIASRLNLPLYKVFEEIIKTQVQE